MRQVYTHRTETERCDRLKFCPNEHEVGPGGRRYVEDGKRELSPGVTAISGHYEDLAVNGWVRLRHQTGGGIRLRYFCSEEHAQEWLAGLVIEPATSWDFATDDGSAAVAD